MLFRLYLAPYLDLINKCILIMDIVAQSLALDVGDSMILKDLVLRTWSFKS